MPPGAIPAARETPGSPVTAASKVPNVHVDRAFSWPLYVSVPLQPPASGPVALNGRACGAGVFVSPCPVNSNHPVGLAGVPPHVQTVSAAWAGLAPPAAAAISAAAPAHPA